MWGPLWGKRRLLYDCVWIVFASQLCVNPASTLDESPRGSKFTSRNVADKLYLSSLIYALIAAFQLVTNHESTNPSVTLVHCYHCCCKDHTILLNLTTLLCNSLRDPLGTLLNSSCLKIVIWLILPVVICLSQRLSHACLSINNFVLWNCEWLIKSVIVYLIIPYYLDNRGNSRANTC